MRKLQCDVSFSHVLSLSTLPLGEDRVIFECSTGNHTDVLSFTRETEGVMNVTRNWNPKFSLTALGDRQGGLDL